MTTTNNPALFKKITNIRTFDTYPTGSLEAACRAQLSDYTVGTVNFQDMAYDENSNTARTRIRKLRSFTITLTSRSVQDHTDVYSNTASNILR